MVVANFEGDGSTIDSGDSTSGAGGSSGGGGGVDLTEWAYSPEEDQKTASGSDYASAVADYTSDQSGDPRQDTTADSSDDATGGTVAWDTNNDGTSDVVTGGHDMNADTDEGGVVDTSVESASETSTTTEENSAQTYDPAEQNAAAASNSQPSAGTEGGGSGLPGGVTVRQAAVGVALIGAVVVWG